MRIPSKFLLYVLSLSLLFSCNREVKEKNADEFILKMNIHSKPKNLNPFYYSSSLEKHIVQHIFQTILCSADSGAGMVPLLAESLPEKEVIDSIIILHYTLRKDAKWTNGESISTKDVINSFKTCFNPYTNLDFLREYFNFLIDIKYVSDSKFDMHCRSYSYDLIAKSGDLDIMYSADLDPEKKYENYSLKELINWNDTIIDSTLIQLSNRCKTLAESKNYTIVNGTGPYFIEKYSDDGNIELRKKDQWWGNSYCHISKHFCSNPERIQLILHESDINLEMAAINNELDIIYGTDALKTEEFMKNQDVMENYYTENYLLSGVVYITFNNENDILINKNVRKALSFLVAPEKFTESFLKNSARAVGSPLEPSIPVIPYSIDSCIKYLNKAGWERSGDVWLKNDKALELDFVLQSGNKNSEDYAVFFKNNCEQLSIKINLIPLEFSTYLKRIKEGEFGITRLGMGFNPNAFNYRIMFHSEGEKNYAQINNPLIDKLIEDLSLVNQEQKVYNLQKEINLKLHEEHSIVYLYIPIGNSFIRKNLNGFHILTNSSIPWGPALQRVKNE